jgi:hypothetical protein
MGWIVPRFMDFDEGPINKSNVEVVSPKPDIIQQWANKSHQLWQILCKMQ